MLRCEGIDCLCKSCAHNCDNNGDCSHCFMCISGSKAKEPSEERKNECYKKLKSIENGGN